MAEPFGRLRTLRRAVSAAASVAAVGAGAFLLAAPAQAEACPNEALRTQQGSTALPDCRAYEQVSPVGLAKNGADALGNPGITQATPSGSAVSYYSQLPFSGIPGSAEKPEYLGSRSSSPGSWSFQGLLPATEPGALDSFIGLTEDSARSIVVVGTAQPPLVPCEPTARICGSLPVGNSNAYLIDNATGAFHFLASTTENNNVFFVAASPDDSRLLLETQTQLLPAAAPGVNNLYEWDGSKPQGQQLSLVGLLPASEGGAAPAQGSAAGALGPGGPFSTTRHLTYTQHTISPDGSRIFFTDIGTGRLYERLTQAEETVPIAPGPAVFHEATSDGRYVFYTEAGDLYRFDTETEATLRLTGATGTGNLSAATGSGDFESGSAEVKNVLTSAGAFQAGQQITAPGISTNTTITEVGGGTLILSNPATEAGTGVSLNAGSTTVEALSTSTGAFSVGMAITAPGISSNTTITAVGAGTLILSNPATEAGAGVPLTGSAAVLGTLGVSADGATAYFDAEAGLTAAERNEWGNAAQPGQHNLYSWREDPQTHAATTTFIANGNDSTDWRPNADPESEPGGPSGGQRTSRLTSGGAVLLFSSLNRLTSYDNESPTSCGLESPGPCTEFYRYDSAAPAGARLTCVTCNPTGAPPSVSNFEGRTRLVATNEAVSNHPAVRNAFLTRNLSADGAVVFFQTAESLLPADTNGAVDVYEWEAPSHGSCPPVPPGLNAPGAHCLFLISSGQSPEQSYFGDASASGNDVFFFTRQPLVSQDTDQNVDVYDARVGGGIAAQNPPAAAPPCEADACKLPAVSGRSEPTPASESFIGFPNPEPKPPLTCKKGFVKKHSKCVKRHPKKHHSKHHRSKKSHSNRSAHNNRRAGR